MIVAAHREPYRTNVRLHPALAAAAAVVALAMAELGRRTVIGLLQ